jgi:CO/xanthine dehydrogenase Mo-binding subunit
MPELQSASEWSARDFAAAQEGELPMGENLLGWSYGNLDQGFAAAKLVLDETFVTASNPHQSMEPRSAFAYWQNGKCYLHGSSQSHTFLVPGLANLVGIPPDQLVYIAEFCGGGFGSKGSAYAVMSIPAHMSKKINRPCMLRITRAEGTTWAPPRRLPGSHEARLPADGKRSPPTCTSCSRTARRPGSGTRPRPARRSRSCTRCRRCASARSRFRPTRHPADRSAAARISSSA